MANNNTIVTTTNLTTTELIEEIMSSKPEHLKGVEPDDLVRLIDIIKNDQPEVVQLIVEGKFPSGFFSEDWVWKMPYVSIPTPVTFIDCMTILMAAFESAAMDGIICDAIRVARGLQLKGGWSYQWEKFHEVEKRLIKELPEQSEEEEEFLFRLLGSIEKAVDEADLWIYEEGGEGNA